MRIYQRIFFKVIDLIFSKIKQEEETILDGLYTFSLMLITSTIFLLQIQMATYKLVVFLSIMAILLLLLISLLYYFLILLYHRFIMTQKFWEDPLMSHILSNFIWQDVEYFTEITTIDLKLLDKIEDEK